MGKFILKLFKGQVVYIFWRSIYYVTIMLTLAVMHIHFNTHILIQLIWEYSG